jgi:hypothetical protein
MILLVLVKITIPGLFRFKGDGVKQAFLEHVAWIQMFFILLNFFSVNPSLAHKTLELE